MFMNGTMLNPSSSGGTLKSHYFKGKRKPIDNRAIGEISRGSELWIRRIEGIPISKTGPESVIFFKMIMGQLFTQMNCGGTPLVARVEAIALERKNPLFGNDIVQNLWVAYETYGHCLTRDMPADSNGKKTYWERSQMMKLLEFLLKTLKLFRQREIVHRQITPGNIFRSEDFNFRISGFEDAKLAKSTIAVPLPEDQTTWIAARLMKKSGAAGTLPAKDWYDNDQFMAGLTILSVALQLTPEEIKNIMEMDIQGLLERVEAMKSKFGDAMAIMTGLLIKGTDLDEICKTFDQYYTGYLSMLDYETLRDQIKVKGIVEKTRKKLGDEISKLIQLTFESASTAALDKLVSNMGKPKDFVLQEGGDRSRPSKLYYHSLNDLDFQPLFYGNRTTDNLIVNAASTKISMVKHYFNARHADLRSVSLCLYNTTG